MSSPNAQSTSDLFNGPNTTQTDVAAHSNDSWVVVSVLHFCVGLWFQGRNKSQQNMRGGKHLNIQKMLLYIM